MPRATLLCLLLAPALTQERPPNVLWIVADDAGWLDFGFQGGEPETPHLDALARAGVRCSQAYVSASVCSPSRAGLLTGRYQQRFGHEFNLPRRPEPGDTLEASGMDVTERTVADRFAASGYRTAGVGKWHLGMAEHFHPTVRGFEHWYGLRLGSRSYFPIDTPAPGIGLERGREAAPEPAQGEYLTDVFTAEAVRFLEQQAGAPFFLYLSYTAVHGPMHATDADLAQVPEGLPAQRRKLLAMTRALDRGVGEVLATLDRLGLREDTLVVFLNDNGGATNNASDNGPLRGRKGDHFEGGVRVPLVLSWPGRLPVGVQYDLPVSTLDLLPTSLVAAALPVTAELDGVDLVPYLRSERRGRPHEQLFWRRGPIATVREGDLKLIRVTDGPVRLFDLARDPGETRDLAATRPETVAALGRVLAGWEAGLSAPRWRTADVWRRKQVELHSAD